MQSITFIFILGYFVTVLFSDIEVIFLAFIVEPLTNRSLIILILIAAASLQRKLSFEPVWRLFTVTIFLLWEYPSTGLRWRLLSFQKLKDMTFNHREIGDNKFM
jgi:hypothetical protein